MFYFTFFARQCSSYSQHIYFTFFSGLCIYYMSVINAAKAAYRQQSIFTPTMLFVEWLFFLAVRGRSANISRSDRQIVLTCACSVFSVQTPLFVWRRFGGSEVAYWFLKLVFLCMLPNLLLVCRYNADLISLITQLVQNGLAGVSAQVSKDMSVLDVYMYVFFFLFIFLVILHLRYFLLSQLVLSG